MAQFMCNITIESFSKYIRKWFAKYRIVHINIESASSVDVRERLLRTNISKNLKTDFGRAR